MSEKKKVLSCEGLSKTFDGFLAVNQVSFEMFQGEICFVIGPNGAGKTTLLDMICGKIKPSQGKIYFMEEQEITQLKEFQISRLGISRKFQNPSIFHGLTVYDNLVLAGNKDYHLFSTFRGIMTRKEKDEIDEILELIHLSNLRDRRAGDLSHGQKQWLEIGMLLMQKPLLLLLDEPTAGMTLVETQKTGEILQSVAKDRSILIVEHDMEFVRNFSTRVIVMHAGQILFEGTMEEVQEHQLVKEVYLGQESALYVAS